MKATKTYKPRKGCAKCREFKYNPAALRMHIMRTHTGTVIAPYQLAKRKTRKTRWAKPEPETANNGAEQPPIERAANHDPGAAVLRSIMETMNDISDRFYAELESLNETIAQSLHAWSQAKRQERLERQEKAH